MADYIMDMRRRVGHIPLMQCGASVIVENERGEVLLQQRSDNGAWGYAGGAVELYEHVEDAARRELLEETGLQAGEMELLGVFSGPEMAYTYPNGDQVSNVDVVYLCRDWQGELKCQPGEVEALGFFAPDALPTPLHEVNRPALNAWRKLREARRQP